jgi:hypothetical protein
MVLVTARRHDNLPWRARSIVLEIRNPASTAIMTLADTGSLPSTLSVDPSTPDLSRLTDLTKGDAVVVSVGPDRVAEFLGDGFRPALGRTFSYCLAPKAP